MASDKEMNDFHGLDNSESDGNTSFLRAARNGQLEKVLEYLKTNIDINTSNANGLNALHLASKDGHVEIVEELLKRGAIVDAATKKGNTALHIASLAGQEEVVKLLVQHGASVNVQSQNGFTPLYMAAQENHDNVVKFLLANGANQSLSTEDGFTPLAVAMQQGHDKVVTVLLENDTRGKVRLPALHIAAKKDDVRAAKLLLENDHNPDVTSKSGFTPLHIASHYGNQPIANLLVQKGADVNYSAKHNITPLHVAAKWGKSNMVSLLLEQGAHIEAKTRDGLTPLHCAARSGHEQVVDMLLEKSAPISSKTKNGLAPLHMAAQGDHVDAARILLYHRAPVDEVTVDYLTALHVAAHCGHVRVAKLLLDRQADANARALNGFTPLHIACKKNRIKVVELLLKHGACIGATTESGLTPLHVASFMGCMNIVIYLLQHDASPDIPTVRGETPLHLAARANQTDIIRILLRNGAQVDARAREQQTPLHVASRLGNVDIVMLLLQHGAKIDNTTKDLYTSLHIAAKEGQDEVAAVLIENGASLNSTTKKGFTPLHLAAKYGHLKVAKLLVQKEAPVDAQGKNGVTPLHVASHYDHQNVALLLLEKGASPHAEAKNGHTPLHIAARKNQMDVAHTLLEYGAKPDVESKAGFTPLHLSSQEGHAEISSLLLEHRATPDYPSKNGLTPLHLCAQENRVAVADLLHKNGADIDKQTKAGYTPLHIASHYGQADMVKFLLSKGANVKATTSLGYTPLHQAAQQGHTNIVNILLENSAQPNAVTNNGQTPLNIAQKLGYITVIDTLKEVTETAQSPVPSEEKYRHVAPELMHETFLSDSEEEGEDTLLGDQTYRYLTADEMKSLGDDSLPIDVTRDERIDSNRMVGSEDPNAYPPRHIEDSISPEHIHPNYVEYIKKATDNVDISRHPVNIGFLVSFLVDARGGAMRGCRHSGVRVIVPPRCAPSPTRITCRYVRPQRTPHPPPLMEGEALASRVLELGPVGAKFLGPVIIEVPHFAALRGKEREIVILRSDNGESWKEHTVEATEDVLNEVLRESFDTEDLNQLEDHCSGRTTRIITQDFPQYFAVISRIRQEVHAIGPEGGMVSSTVVPQVQAVFPQGALTKKIKVGLQAQPIDPELTAKLLGHGVAVSPVVTVEPRRRKFHKAITLSMPAPRAHSQGMINQYSGSAPTLRLLCSITGGTSRAQWEDVTGSTPLTFVNDCVSFTTTVSARFWLMDCRNVGDATKMATELYREAIHVPFIAKFVVFAKRIDPLEARLRVFCMTDDKEEKTLEYQEQFTEIAKSRDVEVLEGKCQFIEFAGNLVPITKSGEQLQFSFRAFKENRLPFSVRVKDQHAEAVSRCLFMREPKVQKGEAPQQPICILNIVLPDDIVSETISLTDSESIRKKYYANENFDYYRQDPRLADMSNLLGDDWVDVATHLGLTSSEINVIKSEYPDSVAKQAQSMLRMWLSQSGSKVQTNTLENALRRIGREDIVNQCLNIDNRNQEILRIRTEEKEKHRLISDNRIEDKSSQEKYSKEERIIKSFTNNLDKYSAEEKTFEPSDEEEEDFNKTVPERREQIVKRLSTERTIPASSQRVEIVQEISSIKRQSLVEDKIAEVQQKANIEPMKINMNKPVSKIIQEKKEQKEEMSEKTEKSQINAQNEEKRDDQHLSNLDDQDKPDRRDSVLLEEVTQLLETKRPVVKLTNQEDPNSPEFSKTPPPSPADFLKEKQATTIQEWNATEDTEKLSRPQPESIREETTGKTSSSQYFIKLDDKSKNNQDSPVVTFPDFNNEDHFKTRQKTTTESTKVTESNVSKHVLAGIDFSEENTVIEKQDDEASKECQQHEANLVGILEGEPKTKSVETSDINNDSAAERIQDKFVSKEVKFQDFSTKPSRSQNQLDKRHEAERKEENEKSEVKQLSKHETREVEENEDHMEKKKNQNKTITNEDIKKEVMEKEMRPAENHKEGDDYQEMKVTSNDFILMEIDRYDHVKVEDIKRNESVDKKKQETQQSPNELKSATSTSVKTKEFHEEKKKMVQYIETKRTVEKQGTTQLPESTTGNKDMQIKTEKHMVENAAPVLESARKLERLTHAFLTTEQKHYQDSDLKNVKQELKSTETQQTEVEKGVTIDSEQSPVNQKQTTMSDSKTSKEKQGFFSFFKSKSKGDDKPESKENVVERNGENDSISQNENKEQELENAKEKEIRRMKNENEGEFKFSSEELIDMSNDFLKTEVKNYDNIKKVENDKDSKQEKQNLNVNYSKAKPKTETEKLTNLCAYETKNTAELEQTKMIDKTHSNGHPQENIEKLSEDIKEHSEKLGDESITKFSEKIAEKDLRSTYEDYKDDDSSTKQTQIIISTSPGIDKLNDAIKKEHVSQKEEIINVSPAEINKMTSDFISAEIKRYDGQKYSKFNREIQPQEVITQHEYVKEEHEKEKTISSMKIVPETTDLDIHIEKENQEICEEPQESKEKKNKSSIFKFFKGKSGKDKKNKTKDNIPQSYENVEPSKGSSTVLIETEERDGDGEHAMRTSTILPVQKEIKNRFSITTVDKANVPINEGNISQENSKILLNEIHATTKDFLGKEIEHYHDGTYSRSETELKPNGIKTDRDYKIINTSELKHVTHPEKSPTDIEGYSKQLGSTSITTIPEEKMKEDPSTNDKVVYDEGENLETLREANSTFLSIEKEAYEDARDIEKKIDDPLMKQTQNVIDISPEIENVKEEIMTTLPDEINKMTKDFLCAEKEQYDGEKYLHREPQTYEIHSQQEKRETEKKIEPETADEIHEEIPGESEDPKEKPKKSSIFKFFKGKSKKETKSKSKSKDDMSQNYENVEPLKASTTVPIQDKDESECSKHAIKADESKPIQEEVKESFSSQTNVPLNEGDTSQKQVHTNMLPSVVNEETKDFLHKEKQHYHDEHCSRSKTETEPNEINDHKNEKYECSVNAVEMEDNSHKREKEEKSSISTLNQEQLNDPIHRMPEEQMMSSMPSSMMNEITNNFLSNEIELYHDAKASNVSSNTAEFKHLTHPEKSPKDSEVYSKQFEIKSTTTIPVEKIKEDPSTKNDKVVYDEEENLETLRAANFSFLSMEKEAYEDARDNEKKIDDPSMKQTQNVIDISTQIENVNERETENIFEPETADEIHEEITGESEDPKEKPKKSSIFKFFKGKSKKETKSKSKSKEDKSQNYENVEPLQASATVPIEGKDKSEYSKYTVKTDESIPIRKVVKETFASQTNVPMNEGDTSQEQVNTNMLPGVVNEKTKDFLHKEKQHYHDGNYSRPKTEIKPNDINDFVDEKYEYDSSQKQEKVEERSLSTSKQEQFNDPMHRIDMSKDQTRPSMPSSMVNEITNDFLSNEIKLYNDVKASNVDSKSELKTVTISEQDIPKKESRKFTHGSDIKEEEKEMLRDQIENSSREIIQENSDQLKTLEEPIINVTLNEWKKATASFLLEETQNYDRSVNYPNWRTSEEKHLGGNYDQHFKENTVSLKSGQSVPQKSIEEKPLTEKHTIETANEKIQKELTVNGDEKIEETTKITTKRKKSGIFNYLKGKFKKSRSVEADTSKEEYEKIIHEEMLNATSSFLTEEQTRYEDGKPSITKIPLETMESKIQKDLIQQSAEHIPIENEINIDTTSYRKEAKTSTDTSKTASKETRNAESDVKKLDKENINSKQNGHVKKVSFDESMNINRELAMITQSFLEKEKNYDCDPEKTPANISLIESENFKISDHQGDLSKTENIDRKDLLVSDKQSEESNSEIQITLEPHEAGSIKDIGKKELKTLKTKEEKILTEDHEKIDEPSKSYKKKGILGFLKKKSKDTEEASLPLPPLSDNETYKKSEMDTTKEEPTTTAQLDNNKQQVDIEWEIQEKSHPTEESKNKKKQKKTQMDNESTETKGILGFLFKKKKPKNKEETSTYQAAEDFSKILVDTKTFLDRETEMYQDTRRSPSKNTSIEQKTQEELEKLPEKEVIREEMTQVATSNLKNIENHDIERKEEELIDEVPEYTAFDFIKEEIETFEKTRLPCTSKVDSSIRIETEVETVEGDSPKEIITKKIFVTERLVETKDDMKSDMTSQEILKKLMDANEDLKAQLNAQENENQTIFRIQRTQKSQSSGQENRTEGKRHEDNMKQNSHEIVAGEFVENIDDVELARSNIVEDVSIFEEKVDIPKNRNQEVVTDLDDITSDEHSSINSQNTEEIEKVIRGKSPINEENISRREEMLTSQASSDQRIGKSRNKRGSITKFNDQGGTLSDVVNVTEDLVTDLKIEYSPYPKRREEFKNVGIDDEVITCEGDKVALSNRKRKPIFRIESEEENPSNPENNSANEEIDSLIRGLVSEDVGEPVETIRKNIVDEGAVSDGRVDIETIEKKLFDLGKALETLEKLEDSEPSDKNEVRERKLRRIERKFEHMASETNESPPENKQSIELSNSPKTEQYQELVSQLSQDEVMSFQGEYNNLWSEYTFSKTDDWNSKTPDSQADVLELPQGETSQTSEPSDTTTTKDHQASTSERDEEDVSQHQMDQHQLSSEMRDLLREMEEASKK